VGLCECCRPLSSGLCLRRAWAGSTCRICPATARRICRTSDRRPARSWAWRRRLPSDCSDDPPDLRCTARNKCCAGPSICAGSVSYCSDPGCALHPKCNDYPKVCCRQQRRPSNCSNTSQMAQKRVLPGQHIVLKQSIGRLQRSRCGLPFMCECEGYGGRCSQ